MAAELTVILFALHREAKPFLRRCRETELHVHVTGMGEAAVERALDAVFAQQPRHVVTAGFCGSLMPQVRIGAVVEDVGQVVTVSQPVLSVADREALHRRTGALVVDMETHAVVRRCREAGVRCSCVRVVSDDLEHPLPTDLFGAIQGERVASGRLCWQICRRPGLLLDLWRLARHSNRAATILAEALTRALLTPAADRGSPSPDSMAESSSARTRRRRGTDRP